MRPASIVYFERLSILSILVGIAFAMLTWDSGAVMPRQAAMAPGMVLIVQGISLIIVLALVFLISRKASVIAKWILVVLFAIGLVFTVPQLGATLDQGLVGLLQISQMIVQAAAIYFLFTAEARAWFGEKRA